MRLYKNFKWQYYSVIIEELEMEFSGAVTMPVMYFDFCVFPSHKQSITE